MNLRFAQAEGDRGPKKKIVPEGILASAVMVLEAYPLVNEQFAIENHHF
jgi:hypothetical protein